MALALYFWVKTLTAPTPKTQNAHITPLNPEITQTIRGVLQNGDLVFHGRNHSWGNLGAKLSDKDKRFGHVGVAVKREGQWYVIDAGGHPMANDATVAAQPLAAFLFSAQRAATYRPTLKKEQRDIFLKRIEWHAKNLTPFDTKFDLATTDTLYCTELIWTALMEATESDPVQEQTLWKNRRVIAIDDLQFADGMREILSASKARPKESAP